MNMEIDKARELLVNRVADVAAEMIPQRIPAQGSFQRFGWFMQYPGTEHQVRLEIQPSPRYGCSLRASVVAAGTDWMVSNYVHFGDRDDCVAWLRKVESRRELLESFAHLIDRADEEV